jgi:hypothetical protein
MHHCKHKTSYSLLNCASGSSLNECSPTAQRRVEVRNHYCNALLIMLLLIPVTANTSIATGDGIIAAADHAIAVVLLFSSITVCVTFGCSVTFGCRATLAADGSISNCSLVLGVVSHHGPMAMAEVEAFLNGRVRCSTSALLHPCTAPPTALGPWCKL